jgi:hypothetical protein
MKCTYCEKEMADDSVISCVGNEIINEFAEATPIFGTTTARR